MNFDRTAKNFGDNSHTSWETFMDTVRTKDYQKVVSGTMYGNLTPGAGDWTFNKIDRFKTMYNEKHN